MGQTTHRRRRFGNYMGGLITDAREEVFNYWEKERSFSIRWWMEYRDTKALKFNLWLPFNFRLRLYRDPKGLLDKTEKDFYKYDEHRLDPHVLLVAGKPSGKVSQDDLPVKHGGVGRA